MKKSTIILVAVIAALAMWAISAYNGMVKMDESVSTAWSNVENQYQRRADLIPNLVNTVKNQQPLCYAPPFQCVTHKNKR